MLLGRIWVVDVIRISSFSSIGWIFSRGSDAIPFPQPKPRTVRIHIIMPSVCSRKVAQLEWSGVRKGENVLQPFNLCDRLLGVHSASIFTRSMRRRKAALGQKVFVEGARICLVRTQATRINLITIHKNSCPCNPQLTSPGYSDATNLQPGFGESDIDPRT